jgi:hypothetical protein
MNRMGYAGSHLRWGDNDRRFGPFLYSRDGRGYRPLALMLSSGDDEDRVCQLRLSAFGHTFIAALPPIVRPWRRKVYPNERHPGSWDAATIERLGRDWYWDTHRREYGVSYNDGFLQVHFGRQTHDSSTTQDWCTHLPWTQWRHVRRSFYGLEGEHYATEPDVGRRWPRDDGEWSKRWERTKAMEDGCPSVTFAFADYDGDALTARTRIEEREWRFGQGWFKWLSVFRKPRISRDLDIRFSGETGKRKGSWKGGTTGHSIEMLPGELHEAAFRRYCEKHDMAFVGEAQPAQAQST